VRTAAKRSRLLRTAAALRRVAADYADAAHQNHHPVALELAARALMLSELALTDALELNDDLTEAVA
jgi:hypothetical protein